MKVALASLDCAWEDKAANLERCAALVRRAAAAGADLVAFPEMTLTGFTMNAVGSAEPAHGAPTIAAFSALAREHALHIAFGVVLEGRERPRNSAVVVDRTGREVARYGKLHPFSAGGEATHYEPGESPVSVRLDDVGIGLSICYDIRFPELYTTLAPQCEVMLVIASWPETRIQHWQLLARARALDSQSYVIAVNRTGRDGAGLDHPASSEVIDPWAAPVPLQPDGELSYALIDPAVVHRIRATFPVLRDRRTALYRELLALPEQREGER